jgi:hypothetical protein
MRGQVGWSARYTVIPLASDCADNCCQNTESRGMSGVGQDASVSDPEANFSCGIDPASTRNRAVSVSPSMKRRAMSAHAHSCFPPFFPQKVILKDIFAEISENLSIATNVLPFLPHPKRVL